MIRLCTDQSSITILVAGAPGLRREPGTFPTGGKGPDHYTPSWEGVAKLLYKRELPSRIAFVGFPAPIKSNFSREKIRFLFNY
jgi:hypothetical protein